MPASHILGAHGALRHVRRRSSKRRMSVGASWMLIGALSVASWAVILAVVL